MYPNYTQHTLDILRITEEIRDTHQRMDKFQAQRPQPKSKLSKTIVPTKIEMPPSMRKPQ